MLPEHRGAGQRRDLNRNRTGELVEDRPMPSHSCNIPRTCAPGPLGSGRMACWGVGSTVWLAGSRPRRVSAPNGLGRAANACSPDDFQSMRPPRKSSNAVLSPQCSAFWLKSAGVLRSDRQTEASSYRLASVVLLRASGMSKFELRRRLSV
jgi:hypothetical protein